MKKFTQQVTEGNEFDLPITETEFKEYKEFINNLIYNFALSRMVKIKGEGGRSVSVYAAYDYEKAQVPGREYSILGKVNTNKLLIKKIWQEFEIKNFLHLKNFIRKFCYDLFGENGRFFKSKSNGFSVWDTIRFTELSGEENEKYVAEFITKLFGPESNPIREVTSSYKDMILGIDITFQIDGVEKTCQVKPLKSANFKERGVVVIYSSGVIKKYNTDYIAFVNIKRSYGDKVLLFKNQGGVYDQDNQMVTLPYQNLVNKKIYTSNVD